MDVSGTILGLIIVLAIWFPCIYQFGIEKGRIILFIGVFSIVIIGTTVSKFFDLTNIINYINSLENIWYIIIPIIIIVALMLSYFISTKIYLKKEF